MAHHPFRFGVNAVEAACAEEWIGKAQRIEALGYDTMFAGDHLICFPPIAGMMAAAAATTRLHIGSNVLANDFYHPVILARELAAIDMLSHGRLIVGLGTGFYRPDYIQSGIPLDAPGIRVSRLAEAIQIIKGVFTAEDFSFTGRHYTVHNVSLTPMPQQKPRPPLLLGGGGPRILALAAGEADIVSINIRTTRDGGFEPGSSSPAATAEKIAWVKQAAGDRFATLELSLLCNDVAVTDDREAAAQQFADRWNQFGVFDVELTAAEVLASPHSLIGTIDEIVGAVQRLRAEYGFSFIVISEAQFEALAPVVALLSDK
jgi:probable F420-dependent oxidoreductase